ncbi:hypothetical protein COCON_G00175330 [Conger conger]|uniref:Uncharacterized protein n=1 Tax=Conger conger TaxID=82655 RepID=A0A9Q1HSR0_CONCO|nr:hypothetical protein COCON_G00175330 [Conger conger]
MAVCTHSIFNQRDNATHQLKRSALSHFLHVVPHASPNIRLKVTSYSSPTLHGRKLKDRRNNKEPEQRDGVAARRSPPTYGARLSAHRGCPRLLIGQLRPIEMTR